MSIGNCTHSARPKKLHMPGRRAGELAVEREGEAIKIGSDSDLASEAFRKHAL